MEANWATFLQVLLQKKREKDKEKMLVNLWKNAEVKVPVNAVKECLFKMLGGHFLSAYETEKCTSDTHSDTREYKHSDSDWLYGQ